LLAHIDGQGFDDPYQGFIPSLGSIDYVSSVSGGGYTSVGWMSALCFGETDAPPQRTSLQHSVDVTFEHAMLHTPYPKCSFVANVFLVIGRSVLYHLALAAVVMYCGITQVCAAVWLSLVTLFMLQTLIMFRNLGIGETDDVFAFFAFSAMFLAEVFYCQTAINHSEAFCDRQKFALAPLATLILCMGYVAALAYQMYQRTEWNKEMNSDFKAPWIFLAIHSLVLLYLCAVTIHS
jgi:hypothetical protein